MSSPNCCFLARKQVSQGTGKVVWYSHLFKNFPHFVVIYTVKDFNVVNGAEVFSRTPMFSPWSNKCWQFDLCRSFQGWNWSSYHKCMTSDAEFGLVPCRPPHCLDSVPFTRAYCHNFRAAFNLSLRFYRYFSVMKLLIYKENIVWVTITNRRISLWTSWVSTC